MTRIFLTTEQLRTLSESLEPVAICRPDGNVVGIVSPSISIGAPDECRFTAEEIAVAEAEANGPGPFRTAREVLTGLTGTRRS